jgi:fibronectin-binding autotransporter adhesin
MHTGRSLNMRGLICRGPEPAARRRRPKSRAALCASAFAVTGWLLASQSVDAATIEKANNTTSLNNTGAWVGGALPGNTDTAVWDSTVTTANTVSLGGNVAFGTLQVTSPGGLVTISSGSTLTLNNAAAIDLSSATQSLTINASMALGGSGITQTFNTGNQTLTIPTVTDGTNTLVVSGSGNLVTTGTETLNGLSNYGGTTTVSGGTLTVSGATGSIVDTSAITVTAGATLTDGDTSTSVSNRLNSAATLTLGGASGGGTFGYNTSSASPASQTLASLSIGPGTSSITSNVSTGQLIFTDAGGSGYTVAAGGLLNFGTGSVSFTNAPTAAGGSSVAGTGSSAILLGATLNGTDLVAAGSGTVAAAAYTATTSSANLGSGLNANLTGNFTAADGTAAQALRFGASNLTLTLAGTTTVQSGMIVIGVSGGDNIAGGTLQASSAQPISVYGPSGDNLTISSVIADNGGTVFERVGSNTVTLSGSNTFTGQIYDSSGNLDLNNVNALGAGAANINILTSSTIQSLTSGISIARNWVIDSGATLTYNTNSFDTTLSGTLASSVGGSLGLVKTGSATLHFTGSTVSSPNATLDVQGGTLDVTGSYISSAGAFSWTGATGTVPVITIRGSGIIQESGDLNFTSGTGDQLTLNIQDNGQLVVGARGFFGKGTSSVAVINQSGGLVSASQIFVGAGNTNTTYNLTGGVLKNVNSNGGDVDTGSIINFNGGILTATTSNTFASTNSLSGTTPGRALILSGGLTVDAPSGVTQTLLSPLLGGVSSPALDGGVTKVDSGTLTLSGISTYTGPTIVSSGTLTENFGPSSSSLTTAASNNINSSGNLVLGGNGTFSVAGRGNGTALNTTTSATFVSGATQISLSSVTGLVGGQAISGTGLPANEFISSIDGSIVMLGVAATGPGSSGEAISTIATTGTTSSQTFNTTIVNSGASELSLTNNATSVTLNLGTLQHYAGGVLNLATAPTSSIIVDTASSNDASGIVGPWFTIGSGTSLEYGTISSGQIVGYTGQTPATANFANVTSATTNYSYTGSATLGGNRTANTLTQGAAGTTIGLNGNSLTLNGIMLNGATSTMTISGTGSVVIGANQELVITQDGTSGLTISSSVVDNGAGPSCITYSGGNQLTLSGANSYSGGTTVDAGTLHIGGTSGTPLGSTSATLTVNGGVLDLNGTNLTVGNLAGSFIGNAGSIADKSSTAATLTIGSGNATGGNYSGAISSGTGVVSLVKTGTGLQTLGGANTATGTIAIDAGTLQFAKEVSLYNDVTADWTASNISVAIGATLGVNIGGIGQFTAADVATITGLGNGSGGGFQSGSSIGLDTTSGSYTYTTAITNPNGGGNALGLTKLGTNTLTLSAASTYTGLTTVAGGTLALSTASANNIASSNAISVGAGATLDLTGVTATGGFALSGTGTQSSSQTVGGSGTVKGNISIAAGASISAGTGAFAGTGANTTGALTLNTGTTTFGAGGNYIWKINNATGAQGSSSGWDSLNISSLALNPTTASPFTVQLQTVDGSGNLDGVAANFSNSTNYQWIIATVPAASVTTTTAGLTLPTAGNSTTLATSGSSGAFVLDTSNFNLNQPPTASGDFFQLSLVNVSGTDELVVGYNTAPEPGAAMLLLAGVTPMLLARRRRRGFSRC